MLPSYTLLKLNLICINKFCQQVKRDEKSTLLRLHASMLPISGLLTLLSKYFATFPQGNCLLLISHICLAMNGGYHSVCALLQKSVTQGRMFRTVRVAVWKGNSLRWRILPDTLNAILIGNTTQCTNQAGSFARLLHTLNSYLFARRYSGNPGWFRFLRLLICLN